MYDITDYLRIHPGGKQILVEYSGTDIDKYVEKYHSHVNVSNILKKNIKGYIWIQIYHILYIIYYILYIIYYILYIYQIILIFLI